MGWVVFVLFVLALLAAFAVSRRPR